jgi:poly-gamma-glutamate capsule biosynthesis protein CapA/YwtB (metallophosphatase superfamily)
MPTVSLPPNELRKVSLPEESEEAEDRVESQTLLVTGDVLTARYVNELVLQKNDFLWPFRDIQPILENADLTWINLETPLVSNCPRKIDGMVFCGDLRHATTLKNVGVDVVNIANNHIGNQGAEGVAESVLALRREDLAVSGVVSPEYVDRNGWRWAFLGFNEVDQQPGVLASEPSSVERLIREAKMNADIVVVQFHWGAEYTRQPTSHQQLLAHLAVDSGADLVVGNHPHWFQPSEWYKDVYIMYSHGNTVFDQMWSEETREGVIGRYHFVNKKFVGVEWVPIWIEEYGRATEAKGERANKVLLELDRVTRDFADDGVVSN